MIDDRQLQLDGALSQIEDSILPTVTMMLDTLLDAAVLGRPGIDAEAYASELRILALQVDFLTQRFGGVIGRSDSSGYSITSAA